MKDKMKKILLFIIAVFIGIVIFDVILVLKGQPTISKTITYYSFIYKITFAPLLIGVLGGHFFLPSKFNLLKKWYHVIFVGITLIIVSQLINSFIIQIHPIILMGIGIVSGALFWNQKPPKEIK